MVHNKNTRVLMKRRRRNDFCTENGLLFLSLVGKKTLISSQALHSIKLSVTSLLSAAPKDLLQCSGHLVKSQQCELMFEL